MGIEVAIQQGLVPRVGELLSFAGLAPHRSSKLSKTAVTVVDGICSYLTEILSRAIDQKTAASFSNYRSQEFASYVDLTRSLADLLRVMVHSPVTLDQLVFDSFSEIESELRDEAEKRFGAAASEQALFTVWTMRKVKVLVAEISQATCPEESMHLDAQHANDFNIHMLWAKFHLECLLMAIHLDRPIYPGVVESIIDGLRAAVNAYGAVRSGLLIRTPRSETEEPSANEEWDDEDQALLAEACADELPY